MGKINAHLEFNLDDLGFANEATEVKSIVLHGILKDLNIPFRRYYSKKSDKNYKRVRKTNISPQDLTLKFLVECDEAHLQYIAHLFKKKMRSIIKLEKCYEKDII